LQLGIASASECGKCGIPEIPGIPGRNGVFLLVSLYTVLTPSPGNRAEMNVMDSHLVPGSAIAVPIRSQPKELTQAKPGGVFTRDTSRN